MNNSMVAHNWAHGRAGKGSNLTTDGARLVSYNTLIGYNTGRGLVFLSSDNMTPTTAKQLCYARRACSHLDVVYSPAFSRGAAQYGVFDETRAFNLACNALNEELARLGKARISKYLASNIDRALDKMDELNAIAVKYGYQEFVYTSVVTDRLPEAREYAAKSEERARVAAEARRVKEAKRQVEQRLADADQFAAWLRGEDVRLPASYRHDERGGYYLSLRGDKVITSGGAECPLEHAIKGLQFYISRFHTDSNLKTYCEPWQKNGHTIKLGVFQLDRIDEQGNAYAGCHKFTEQELRRFAATI